MKGKRQKAKGKGRPDTGGRNALTLKESNVLPATNVLPARRVMAMSATRVKKAEVIRTFIYSR